MRQIMFRILIRVSRLVARGRLGIKFPSIGVVYSFLFRHLKPAQDTILVNVRGIKMYADVSGYNGLGPGSIHCNYEKGETTPVDIDSLMQMCPGEIFTSIYLARH